LPSFFSPASRQPSASATCDWVSAGARGFLLAERGDRGVGALREHGRAVLPVALREAAVEADRKVRGGSAGLVSQRLERPFRLRNSSRQRGDFLRPLLEPGDEVRALGRLGRRLRLGAEQQRRS
jgi:hypothetical protein